MNFVALSGIISLVAYDEEGTYGNLNVENNLFDFRFTFTTDTVVKGKTELKEGKRVVISGTLEHDMYGVNIIVDRCVIFEY